MNTITIMLNSKHISNTIELIKDEIGQFKIPDDLLYKFTTSAQDKEFKSYIEGHGGSYIKFLSLLVNKLQLKNILELGNREGMSTLSIYSGLTKNGHFTTVDIETDQRFCPDVMFKDPRVEFIFGDVCDLSIYKSIPLDIDFLFTDTIHYDFQLQDEWAIYQHLLADKALVAIDDINLNDKRKLFDFVPYPKWDLTELCHVSGWGLFLYERGQKISNEGRIKQALSASANIWRKKYIIAENQLNEFKNRKFINRLRSFIFNHPKLLSLSRRIKKMIYL